MGKVNLGKDLKKKKEKGRERKSAFSSWQGREALDEHPLHCSRLTHQTSISCAAADGRQTSIPCTAVNGCWTSILCVAAGVSPALSPE